MKVWKISTVAGTIVVAFGLVTALASADSGAIYSGSTKELAR